jgi:signal peptidase I
MVAILVLAILVAFGSGYFRNFYLPSEAMAPTLGKEDRFVAFMGGGGTVKRGDVIVFAVGEWTYVKRVAALAGDRIGLSEGVVILNGRPVAQRFLKAENRPDSPGTPVRRLAELFPGEAAPHEILDLERSDFDDFPERRVPDGFVFVLGDNRDRSADSRVPRVEMGVELLPVADIKGHALFYTWPRAKMGRKVSR